MEKSVQHERIDGQYKQKDGNSKNQREILENKNTRQK